MIYHYFLGRTNERPTDRLTLSSASTSPPSSTITNTASFQLTLEEEEEEEEDDGDDVMAVVDDNVRFFSLSRPCSSSRQSRLLLFDPPAAHR